MQCKNLLCFIICVRMELIKGFQDTIGPMLAQLLVIAMRRRYVLYQDTVKADDRHPNTWPSFF